jgi:hypothetical protein
MSESSKVIDRVRMDDDYKHRPQELLTTRQWIYLLKEGGLTDPEELVDGTVCSTALEGSPIVMDGNKDSDRDNPRFHIHFVSNASYWDFVDKVDAIKERWNDIEHPRR